MRKDAFDSPTSADAVSPDLAALRAGMLKEAGTDVGTLGASEEDSIPEGKDTHTIVVEAANADPLHPGPFRKVVVVSKGKIIAVQG
jgi:hypothetical protein